MHETIQLTDEERRRRRRRSIALGLVLAGLVVLVYVITWIKGPGVINKPL